MLQKTFRRILLATTLSLPVLSFNIQGASADQRDFTVVNNTGSTIIELYVSPAKVDSWEEDVLEDTIPPGESGKITFDGEFRKTCVYDVKAKYKDGDTSVNYNVNLCETSTITYSEN